VLSPRRTFSEKEHLLLEGKEKLGWDHLIRMSTHMYQRVRPAVQPRPKEPSPNKDNQQFKLIKELMMD
jgi:hypothetical protein